MKKTLLLLAIGLAAGYWWGFNDAQSNTENVAVRIIGHAGGTARERVKTNPDRQLDSLEQK
jgi:hypothetical protein